MTCIKPVLASRHGTLAEAAFTQQAAFRHPLQYGARVRMRLQTPEPPMPGEVPPRPPAPPIDPAEPVAPPMEPPTPNMPPIGDPPGGPGSPRGVMQRRSMTDDTRRHAPPGGYFY